MLFFKLHIALINIISWSSEDYFKSLAKAYYTRWRQFQSKNRLNIENSVHFSAFHTSTLLHLQ